MMEDELNEISDHSLESIQFEFFDTSVDKKILRNYSKTLYKARSVAELH